jgi:hypothetical protein
LAAILVGSRDHRTQFWKGATQWSFHQSLVAIGGQNCSILSQNVPKFELLKHNDELLNIYYGIFYELWTFADFDRLCILEKRGDGCGGHLGQRAEPPDIILEENHPMTISSKKNSYWANGFRKDFYGNFP